jgi:hypothetical protein
VERAVRIEDAVAIERVVRRGEAPARHRRDHVDFVEQRTRFVLARLRRRRVRVLLVARHRLVRLRVPMELHVPELREHALGQRRRARAAPGQRQYHKDVIRVVRRLRRRTDGRLLEA